MKKIFILSTSLLLFLIILSIVFLSTIGYETDKFNLLLENKITKNFSNTKINLSKIKIKIDIKNLNFFITTSNPDIYFHSSKIDLKKINAYMNLKSIIIG